MATIIENHKIRSCIWLVYLLKKHPGLTFDEIDSHWRENIDLSKGQPLPKRTFHDRLDSISDIFGINIACQRRGGYKWYIEYEDEDKEGLIDWLLSSFTLGQLANEAQDVRDRVLLSAAPQGMHYFELIIEALHIHCCLAATYHRFDAEAYACHLRPYALKMFEGRWYVLAQKNDEELLKTFCLDRFEGEMTLLTDETFTPPEDFDAAEFFANCFGIFTGTGEVPTIRLHAEGTEVRYLQTKPLHPSQQQDPCDPAIFTIRCYPTQDLLYAILSHGRKLTVLEPADFRDRIREEVSKIAEGYK